MLAGGFGSAVWETLSDQGMGVGGAPILRVGLPDALRHPRRARLLHEEVGFTGRAHRRARRGCRRRAQPRSRSHGLTAEPAGCVPCRAVSMRRRPARCTAGRARVVSRRARARRRRCSPERCGSAPGRTTRREARPARRRGRARSTLDEAPAYVSRGGIKLANALERVRARRERRRRARRRRLDRRVHRLPAAARRGARGRPRRRLRPARLALRSDPRVTRDRARQRAGARARELPYRPG